MLMPTVHRFMTLYPFTVTPRDTMAAAHRIMRERCIRHLPVIENGKAVGMVSDRDLRLVAARSSDPGCVPVGEVMSKAVIEVTPNTPMDEAIELMTSARCDSLVVNGKTGVVGILTSTDALFALTDLLRRHAA